MSEQQKSSIRQAPKIPRGKLLKRLWQYLGRYRLLLVLAMILVILTNALSLAGPKLSGLAIDAIGIGQGQADFDKLLLYTGLMALCYLASALTGYLLNRITIRLTRNTTYRMRKDVFDKLVSLPVGFFDGHQAGDLISVLSYDDTAVRNELLSHSSFCIYIKP